MKIYRKEEIWDELKAHHVEVKEVKKVYHDFKWYVVEELMVYPQEKSKNPFTVNCYINKYENPDDANTIVERLNNSYML